MDIKKKYQLKKFIKELEKIRGRHTELVSVYIPKDYDINKIIQHLEQEQSTAKNIKDARNRSNVIDSLERAIRHLRLYKKTPENGLAVFAGNASENESKIDIRVWSIEPPEPISTRLYRCDQYFVLDILRDQIEVSDVFGLIVLDRRDGAIGILTGSRMEMLLHLTSGVGGKHKTGGQSAARFARLREEQTKEFFNRIGNAANKQFLGMKELKGVIVGGPGPTKEEFLDGNYLNNELKRKLLGVKDLGYTGEDGLHEMVDKSQDLLEKEEVMKEKVLVQRLLEMLAKEADKVAYGKKDVEKALDIGAVDTLLLSESLDDSIIEELSEKAEKTGSSVQIISDDSREGVQLKELGGIAAILRYAI